MSSLETEESPGEGKLETAFLFAGQLLITGQQVEDTVQTTENLKVKKEREREREQILHLIPNAFAHRKVHLDCWSPFEIFCVIFAWGPQTLDAGQVMAVCGFHRQTQSATEMGG